jgi:hypothetical protein
MSNMVFGGVFWSGGGGGGGGGGADCELPPPNRLPTAWIASMIGFVPKAGGGV